jgi:hypothetical protein
VLLAAAVGVKVWPLLLVGVAWRGVRNERRIAVTPLLGFLVTAMLIALLYVPAFLGADSGAKRYAGTWDANAGLYSVLVSAGGGMLAPREAHVMPRYLLAGLTFLCAAAWSRRPLNSIEELFDRAGGILLIALLLSPTLYPWYAVPLAALAALRPRPSLLLWTLLLPLIYTDPQGLARGAVLLAVHVPAWLLVILQVCGRSASPPSQVAAHA